MQVSASNPGLISLLIASTPEAAACKRTDTLSDSYQIGSYMLYMPLGPHVPRWEQKIVDHWLTSSQNRLGILAEQRVCTHCLADVIMFVHHTSIAACR